MIFDIICVIVIIDIAPQKNTGSLFTSLTTIMYNDDMGYYPLRKDGALLCINSR